MVIFIQCIKKDISNNNNDRNSSSGARSGSTAMSLATQISSHDLRLNNSCVTLISPFITAHERSRAKSKCKDGKCGGIKYSLQDLLQGNGVPKL